MSKSREDGSKSGVFSEQPNSKLEWMYKNSTELLNREEYLLGKSIDKNFEQLNDEESANKLKSLVGVTVPKNHVEHECIPFSIRSYRSNHNDEQVDIQRKIIEDPLMAIRQKEMESRRKILENPVKLKELHRLLKKEEESKKKNGKHSKKSKKKKDKKHRKSKKKHKKSDSHDSSSSGDEDLDTLLARKYRQIQEELGPNDGTFSKLNLKKLLNSKVDKHVEDEVNARRTAKKRKSSESGSSDSDDEPGTKRNNYRDYDSQRHSASSYRNKITKGSPERHRGDKRAATSSKETERSSRKDDRRHSSDRKLNRRHEYKVSQEPSSRQKQKSSKNKSSSESSSSSSSEDSGEKPTRKTYGLVTAAGKKIKLKHSDSSKPSSTSNHGKQAEKSKTPAHSMQSYRKEKLTDEEKQRRCHEMVQNAAWRDTERKQKVDKYKEECEREKNEIKDYDKSFINKEVHKAMQNQTSVESRLKANINNIQRSDRAMERNFARR